LIVYGSLVEPVSRRRHVYPNFSTWPGFGFNFGSESVARSGFQSGILWRNILDFTFFVFKGQACLDLLFKKHSNYLKH
jgi:hypothetical protein